MFKYGSNLLLGFILIFVLYLRLNLIDIPFERDEGEYAYMGQQILEGILPYISAYNMKLPGTSFMYAIIISIFGSSIEGIHLGLTSIFMITLILMYLSFKNIFSTNVALISILLYGVMASSITTLGFAGHATHFINLFIMLGLYIWTIKSEKYQNHYIILFGITMGLSFLMKQQAIFFYFFASILLLSSYYASFKKDDLLNLFKKVVLFTFGYVLPYLLLLGIIAFFGDFQKFWFWTVTYASKYSNDMVKFDMAIENFMFNWKRIYNTMPFLWYGALIGVILLFRLDTLKRTFVIIFTIFAFLSICPGLYFRPHYFISFLPAIALLCAIGMVNAVGCFKMFIDKKLIATILSLSLPMVFVGLSIYKDRLYWFNGLSGQEKCKMAYARSPFNDSETIGKYIKRNSSIDDKIAIFGSEPQIFIYANRTSATGHIYMYGMMEDHPYNITMQEEMIDQVEKNKPKFLLYVNVATSWNRTDNSPTKIFYWMSQYAEKYYSLDGLVEITDNIKSKIVWDGPILRNPEVLDYIYIYKRNE